MIDPGHPQEGFWFENRARHRGTRRFLGKALSIAGTLFNVFGQRKQAKANRRALEYQAKVHRENAQVAIDFGEYNAGIARRNASISRHNAGLAAQFGAINKKAALLRSKDALKGADVARKNKDLVRVSQEDRRAWAKVQVYDRREQTRQVVGAQRTALAANGVVVDQGSAARLVASSHEIGRRDEVKMLADADADIFDMEIEAYNYEQQARQLERQAEIFGTEADAIEFQAAVQEWNYNNEAASFDQEALFAKYRAQVTARNYEHDAKLAEMGAQSATNAGNIGAVTGIIKAAHEFL